MEEKRSTYYEEVRTRLNAFASRYYLDETLRNTAVYLAALIGLIALASVVEYTMMNDSSVRAPLFYALLLSSIIGFVYMVLVPLGKTKGLGKRLSDEELSRRVGEKVGEVDDKLLNLLMLEKMALDSNSPFYKAAMDQKARSIADIPFHLSASLEKGKRFLRNASIFLFLVALGAIAFPDYVAYGTKRLIFYEQEISPPPPFRFNIIAADKAIKNEPYEISFSIDGEYLPREVFIELNGKEIRAQKVGHNEYRQQLKNIREDFSFRIHAEGVWSAPYSIAVMERPDIHSFYIEVDYPSHTGLIDERFENTGNLEVPEGSRLSWLVESKQGDFLRFSTPNGNKRLEMDGGKTAFDTTLSNTLSYSMELGSINGLKGDSINYRIAVVPDQYPSIEVQQQEDSLNSSTTCLGQLSDDYGLSSFRFAFKTEDKEEYQYEELSVPKGKSTWEFYYKIDWNEWNLKKGDEVTYYFEVWDNDGVNGPKASRSRKIYHKVLSEKELAEQKEELAKSIEKQMEEAILESKEMKKEIDALQKDLLEEKNIDWSTKKKIEDLLRKNEELRKTMSEINEKNMRKSMHEDKMEYSDEVKQKRDELERLMQEVLDDEMLEKLKELEALMEKMNKEELNEAMDEIELSNEQLENELDRSLEIFKQIEFEMQLEKVVEELDEMIEEQKELKEDVEEGEGSKDELSEKQQDLKEKFENWEKEMDQLSEKNEALENKHDLDEQQEKREGTKQEMQDASDQLKKGNKNKAGENQQGAQDKMEQMKDDLQALQMSMKAGASEDLQSLRNTLENLIELSFEQENLMGEMKDIRSDDPKFNELTREQRSIVDGMMVVKDSLDALSKRIVQIAPTVNREVLTANMNMEKAIRSMTERKIRDMGRHQQLAMTSINNLSVLLDEIVDQLQQQMMQQSGQCQNPGQSKPSSSSMKQMQQELNRQIEQMKQQMEKGSNPGQKPGQKKAGEAESIAKMAAEQAKIREELRKMSENASQEESKELKKIGDLMEETERDLVNRQISQETLLRQEKILTRLLESEKAERQQDMDEKRESIGAKEKKNGNLIDAKEYYKARYDDHEELIKQNIGFNRYFKDKVEEYFKHISE